MNFKLIFGVIFFAFFKQVAGQSAGAEVRDSLIAELAKVQPDTTRQILYNKIGWFFLTRSKQNHSYIDSAFYYSRKSVYLFDSANTNNSPITNKGLVLLAETYFNANKLDEGKKIFLQVIKSYVKANDKLKEADNWYRLATILMSKQENLEGIDMLYFSASRLYSQLNLVQNKIDADLNIGYVHFMTGREKLSAGELQEVVKFSRKNKNYNLARILLILSMVKRYSGEFNEALRYSMEAQQIVQQNKDTTNVHDAYGELALIYGEMNEPKKSVYWYKQCIDERMRMHFNEYAIYRTTYLMIVQMVQVKEEREGLSILQNLRKKMPPASAVDDAILSQALAYCYNSLGQNAAAEKHFLKMVKIFNEKRVDDEIIFTANFDVGNFYVSQRQYVKADPYLKTAFSRLRGPTASRIKDLYLLMFKVDSAAGRYISAIKHFENYKTLNDSLFNEARSRQIEELNVKYEVETKEQNLTILHKENTLQQKDIKQAKLTRNYILAGLLSLLLIIGLLFNRYQLKQRTNKSLEASQEKIEKQNISLQHLVSEKEWLLKEIHHRVKNNLHTISGLLDAQSGYLKTEEALMAISDSQHRVQAMSLLHQKLFHSESLSNVEMPEYIHELTGYLEHSFGTKQKVKFIVDIDHLRFGLSHALPIGLILNEAITNAIKYAFDDVQDGVINIQLKQQSGNEFLLQVKDTGKGLPADFNSRRSHSMGMNLMQGLSEDINGVFSISNNNGTEIKILFVYDFATGDNFSFHSVLKSEQ